MADVNTFLCDCLYAFAGCTVLGIVPPFVIAGKARNWPKPARWEPWHGLRVFVSVAIGSFHFSTRRATQVGRQA